MRHRLAMTSSSKSPRDTIAIGRKHLLDQRLRIEKHKEFIGKLERDGQPNVIAEARRCSLRWSRRSPGCRPTYTGSDTRGR